MYHDMSYQAMWFTSGWSGETSSSSDLSKLPETCLESDQPITAIARLR